MVGKDSHGKSEVSTVNLVRQTMGSKLMNRVFRPSAKGTTLGVS